MKYLMLCLVAILAALSGACERKQQSEPPTVMTQDTTYVTVFVTALGLVEVNGKSVDLQAVADTFADVAKHHGVVLYARESPDKEPHPNGMKVMELVVQNRLPIRLCTNRDFSEAIGPDGKLRSEKQRE